MTPAIQLYNETSGVGRPILMLHGFGASLYTWRHLAEPLAKNNQVILVDLKGFGKSPKPKDKFYSIQDQADLVLQLILEKDLRNLTLIGHSLGGAVALLVSLRLLKREPDRLASLVLIDSAGYRQDLPGFIDILRTPILGSLLFSLLSDKKKAQMILEEAYFDNVKITREQVRVYASALSASGGEHALFRTAKELIPRDIDQITNHYPEIDVPTLILWGKQDKIVPLVVGKKLRQAIANSEMIILDKCGHIPQEEQPTETINIIIRFIEAHANK